ncbi:endolytic transglycosylase MltG [Candidatus Saccharibacteria bacterium]|nr:endolytic transglycosylase MltG [Candidatus Saccharibacteria bacterium]
MQDSKTTLRRSNKQLTLKKKRSSGRRIFGWLAAATVLAAVTFVVWFIVAMQPVGGANEKQPFIVEPGDTLEIVGLNLQKEGLVRNSFVFTVVAKLTNKTVMAGTHYLSPSQSVLQIAFDLQKMAGSEYRQVTILAGQTLAELKVSLIAVGFAAGDIDEAFDKVYNSPLLSDKPTASTLEGYIFPDTYHLDAEDNASTLVQMAIDNLYNKLKSDGSLDVMKSQGKTIYQTLVMASIVQKEVSDPEEQKNVAGVFANRLQWDMLLGSDVTFHYAYKQGYCTTNTPDCDSVYNTRLYKGLPPGPIANMEYAAIQAVLHPAENEHFFFVAGDNGKTYYATDADGHFENVRNHCHKLCQ